MLTAVINARNEEINLPRCLASLRFCDEILVLDNNSTDQTADVARKLGARVENITDNNDYSVLKNRGLELAKNTWVLYVDADEVVSEELGKEVLAAVSRPDFKGFFVHRIDYLWGRQLHYGDVGQVYLLRLGKKTAGSWTGKVHEIWNIKGPVSRLSAPLYHYPHQSLASFIRSVNYYSDLRSAELYSQGIRSGILPIIFYPLGKFIYLWIFKLGILDGMPGLIHALVMSFYSFLVRGKLYLIRK